jgi:hypothetical protein
MIKINLKIVMKIRTYKLIYASHTERSIILLESIDKTISDANLATYLQSEFKMRFGETMIVFFHATTFDPA